MLPRAVIPDKIQALLEKIDVEISTKELQF